MTPVAETREQYVRRAEETQAAPGDQSWWWAWAVRKAARLRVGTRDVIIGALEDLNRFDREGGR